MGLLLLTRVAEACGLPGGGRGGISYAFPLPEDVAALRPRVLQRVGYSSAKARAILGVARQIAAGRLDLETLIDLDVENANSSGESHGASSPAVSSFGGARVFSSDASRRREEESMMSGGGGHRVGDHRVVLGHQHRRRRRDGGEGAVRPARDSPRHEGMALGDPGWVWPGDRFDPAAGHRVWGTSTRKR